ncbi:phosphonoacetaldehyde reductase [Halocynthiibacter styelae]|uniref:Phosphonoacetaldehyde reductase n=1 Tax=Halocynthiibacter styelae TaxID=2761955 RepID=A0A8J7LW02_9RHOB|nr:phosphonoacetaldehyde reductase [Paenihalocynthiibacter styelae]MBI1493732.1 phosphonoacetaldehyde reductase [Paenihalocynthiibacter styelae]
MPHLISGLNSLAQLPPVLARYPARRILLVTGKGSFAASGAQAHIEAALQGQSVLHFHDFDVNPKIEDAQRGVALARAESIDLILAVGGGSMLDMAKLIKAFYTSPGTEKTLTQGKTPVTDPDIPLIAIPTTAGSGSEATHFAVVYIGADKYSVAAPCLLPDQVILDGALLASASPYQKTCNLLDALAQAIESAWAVGSTGESREYSFEAIDLIMQHARAMVRPGADSVTLQAMAEAAHLAGKAINISKTTAAHAWSYGITGTYGIPHGHAVWLTLPTIFQIHALADETQINDPRGPQHLRAIMAQLMQALSIATPDQASTTLRQFMTDISAEPDLTKSGPDTPEKRAALSKQANMQRMSNNPVQLDPACIESVFML